MTVVDRPPPDVCLVTTTAEGETIETPFGEPDASVTKSGNTFLLQEFHKLAEEKAQLEKLRGAVATEQARLEQESARVAKAMAAVKEEKRRSEMGMDNLQKLHAGFRDQMREVENERRALRIQAEGLAGQSLQNRTRLERKWGEEVAERDRTIEALQKDLSGARRKVAFLISERKESQKSLHDFISRDSEVRQRTAQLKKDQHKLDSRQQRLEDREEKGRKLYAKLTSCGKALVMQKATMSKEQSKLNAMRYQIVVDKKYCQERVQMIREIAVTHLQEMEGVKGQAARMHRSMKLERQQLDAMNAKAQLQMQKHECDKEKLKLERDLFMARTDKVLRMRDALLTELRGVRKSIPELRQKQEAYLQDLADKRQALVDELHHVKGLKEGLEHERNLLKDEQREFEQCVVARNQSADFDFITISAAVKQKLFKERAAFEKEKERALEDIHKKQRSANEELVERQRMLEKKLGDHMELKRKVERRESAVRALEQTWVPRKQDLEEAREQLNKQVDELGNREREVTRLKLRLEGEKAGLNQVQQRVQKERKTEQLEIATNREQLEAAKDAVAKAMQEAEGSVEHRLTELRRLASRTETDRLDLSRREREVKKREEEVKETETRLNGTAKRIKDDQEGLLSVQSLEAKVAQMKADLDSKDKALNARSDSLENQKNELERWEKDLRTRSEKLDNFEEISRVCQEVEKTQDELQRKTSEFERERKREQQREKETQVQLNEREKRCIEREEQCAQIRQRMEQYILELEERAADLEEQYKELERAKLADEEEGSPGMSPEFLDPPPGGCLVVPPLPGGRQASSLKTASEDDEPGSAKSESPPGAPVQPPGSPTPPAKNWYNEVPGSPPPGTPPHDEEEG